MILSDAEITRLVENGEMEIKPFLSSQTKKVNDQRVLSFGLSSYGYDISLADEFKFIQSFQGGVIDPLNFSEEACTQEVFSKDGAICLPPNSFMLARSLEYIRMPEDVLAICIGKSSYARCGIIVNVTPIEPGWYGTITIEISNTTNLPAKIYAYQGIAQLLFLKGEPCDVSYKDREGKYLGQTNITMPR